jgi:hypothetical protein
VTTAKRSETRFCRIPQWLYSVGISLQAVALYGWLHGKYGWLPKINPSYATLAEELGVSRGSIINYFKELIKVGAVRVTVGGPKGRTINSYEIAYDAPFKFASGQPADHSESDHESVVSGLTSSGHSADQSAGQSGQPVVPEVEGLKKVEDSLPSDAPEPAAPEPPEAPVDEREISPLVQKLIGLHAATAAEVQAVLGQVAREGWAKSLSAWALSGTGELDFAERLAKVRGSDRPAVVTDPWQTCGCGRPFRSPEPGPCRDCRELAEAGPPAESVEQKAAAVRERADAIRKAMRRQAS